MAEKRAPKVAAFEAADYDLAALRRVEVRRGRPKASLAVRFDAGDLDRLRHQAEAEGVGVTRVVRRWVLERLDDPDPAAAVDDLMDGLEQSLRAARALRRSTRRRAG